MTTGFYQLFRQKSPVLREKNIFFSQKDKMAVGGLVKHPVGGRIITINLGRPICGMTEKSTWTK
jgi:hypothetical protein